MLRYDMLHCYITLCYVTLHYVTLCYVTLCYITLNYVTLRYVTLCYVMLLYVMLLGTGFAAISLSEQTAGLAGHLLFNMIYSETVYIYSGIVFIVMSFFSLVVVILNT